MKAECPLCKVAFESIIHNVRSQDDYDQYHIVRQAPQGFSSVVLFHDTRNQHQYRAFSEWMANHGLARWRSSDFNVALPFGPPARAAPRGNPNGTSAFRRSIYARDLWARLQPDLTGRYRECSPEFYAQNPAQVHRLIPFLNRELNVLMGSGSRILYVMEKILELIPTYSMTSTRFRREIAQLIGHENAAHFCHELRAFASSPYDLVGYDRNVEYHPSGGASASVEVEDDDSDHHVTDDDDDVQIIEASPTTIAFRNIPSSSVSAAASTSSAGGAEVSPFVQPSSVVTVSSGSESDNPEDVQIVGFVKPRHERTPEIITLSSPEHPNFPSSPPPRYGEASGSSSQSTSDLICINLGSNSSAVHKWQHNINAISSDDDVELLPRRSHQYKPKTASTRHLEPVSSESLQSFSSDSDDEWEPMQSKRQRERKEGKKNHRKHSKSKHHKSSVVLSDDDQSQPSTSRGRTSRRHKMTRSSSSHKTSKSSKEAISSANSNTASDSDKSPPRAVLRSAIVPNFSKTHSSRYSTDEDDVSPHRSAGPKVRNLVVRRTTVEGHDSWNVADTDHSPNSHKGHSRKTEQYRSSNHHSSKSSSRHRHHKHQSSHESNSRRRQHAHSSEDSSPVLKSEMEKKRRGRSRSPKVHPRSSKVKQQSPSFSDDDMQPKRHKKKLKALSYSDSDSS